MISIPTIETERLVLRPPLEKDVTHEVAFYATERSKFVGGPLDKESVWRACASMVGHWAWRGYGYWAVEDKATNSYLGRVGLWNPEGWPEPEISWTLMANAEGKGFAYEAAVRVRDYAFETLGWPTAISLIAKDNIRSIALAERLGAKFDYVYNHVRYGDVNIYRHKSAEALA